MGEQSEDTTGLVIEVIKRDVGPRLGGHYGFTAEQIEKLSQLATLHGLESGQLVSLAVSALLGYADSHRGSLHLPLDLAKRWSPAGWSPVDSGYANQKKLQQIASTVDGCIDVITEVCGYLQYIALNVRPEVWAGAMEFFETRTGYGKDIYHAFAKYARLEAQEAHRNS